MEYGGYVFTSGVDANGSNLYSFSEIQRGHPGWINIQFPKAVGTRWDGRPGLVADPRVAGLFHTHGVGTLPGFSYGGAATDAGTVYNFRTAISMLNFGSAQTEILKTEHLSGTYRIKDGNRGEPIELVPAAEMDKILKCASKKFF
jgi:hypothetical protein